LYILATIVKAQLTEHMEDFSKYSIVSLAKGSVFMPGGKKKVLIISP
jgi:hypothetical protein